MTRPVPLGLAAALILVAPALLPAVAQTAIDSALLPAQSLQDGVIRPFAGLHHFLALVAMGLIAAQLGGRALWEVPVVFLAAMLGGYIAAQLRVPLPYGDFIAQVSVVALGLILAFNWRFTLNNTLFFIGLFAIFHGHSEGVAVRQADAVSVGLGYAIGSTFVLGGAVILGVALLRTYLRLRAARLIRTTGLGIAGLGALLLVF